MSDNVLLNLGDEPRYSDIRPADIKPAMQAAMAEARAAIAEIKAQPESSWANTVERLTGITERVGRIWGVVSHLNSVVDTPELRAEYNALMPEVTVFFTEIGQDIELYNRFKAIKASPEFAALNEARLRVERRGTTAGKTGTAGRIANRRGATGRPLFTKRTRRNRCLRTVFP